MIHHFVHMLNLAQMHNFDRRIRVGINWIEQQSWILPVSTYNQLVEASLPDLYTQYSLKVVPNQWGGETLQLFGIEVINPPRLNFPDATYKALLVFPLVQKAVGWFVENNEIRELSSEEYNETQEWVAKRMGLDVVI